MAKIDDRFVDRYDIISIIIMATYFLFEIVYFFLILFINLIMLIPYLISQGFLRFIYLCTRFERNDFYLKKIFYKALIILIFVLAGGFFYILSILKDLGRVNNNLKKIMEPIYFLFSIILFLVFYFPFIFLINLFTIIYTIINYNRNIMKLNDLIDYTIGYNFVINN